MYDATLIKTVYWYALGPVTPTKDKNPFLTAATYWNGGKLDKVQNVLPRRKVSVSPPPSPPPKMWTTNITEALPGFPSLLPNQKKQKANVSCSSVPGSSPFKWQSGSFIHTSQVIFKAMWNTNRNKTSSYSLGNLQPSREETWTWSIRWHVINSIKVKQIKNYCSYSFNVYWASTKYVPYTVLGTGINTKNKKCPNF